MKTLFARFSRSRTILSLFCQIQSLTRSNYSTVYRILRVESRLSTVRQLFLEVVSQPPQERTSCLANGTLIRRQRLGRIQKYQKYYPIPPSIDPNDLKHQALSSGHVYAKPRLAYFVQRTSHTHSSHEDFILKCRHIPALCR